jgi:hypothetical protein
LNPCERVSSKPFVRFPRDTFRLTERLQKLLGIPVLPGKWSGFFGLLLTYPGTGSLVQEGKSSSGEILQSSSACASKPKA